MFRVPNKIAYMEDSATLPLFQKTEQIVHSIQKTLDATSTATSHSIAVMVDNNRNLASICDILSKKVSEAKTSIAEYESSRLDATGTTVHNELPTTTTTGKDDDAAPSLVSVTTVDMVQNSIPNLMSRYIAPLSESYLSAVDNNPSPQSNHRSAFPPATTLVSCADPVLSAAPFGREASPVMTLQSLCDMLRLYPLHANFDYTIGFVLCDGPWEPTPSWISCVTSNEPWNALTLTKADMFNAHLITVESVLRTLEPFLDTDRRYAYVIDEMRCSWGANDFLYAFPPEISMKFCTVLTDNAGKIVCPVATEKKTDSDEKKGGGGEYKKEGGRTTTAAVPATRSFPSTNGPLQLEPLTLERAVMDHFGALASILACYRVGTTYYTRPSLEDEFPGLFAVSSSRIESHHDGEDKWRALFVPLRSKKERELFGYGMAPHLFSCIKDEEYMSERFCRGTLPLERVLYEERAKDAKEQLEQKDNKDDGKDSVRSEEKKEEEEDDDDEDNDTVALDTLAAAKKDAKTSDPALTTIPTVDVVDDESFATAKDVASVIPTAKVVYPLSGERLYPHQCFERLLDQLNRSCLTSEIIEKIVREKLPEIATSVAVYRIGERGNCYTRITLEPLFPGLFIETSADDGSLLCDGKAKEWKNLFVPFRTKQERQLDPTLPLLFLCPESEEQLDAYFGPLQLPVRRFMRNRAATTRATK